MHSHDLLLEIVEGAEAGKQIPLTAPLEMGRETTLPLPLNDEQVSRRHLRVVPSGSGAVVEDLGSRNGTYVNDQPIHSSRELRIGDRIRAGLTVLELRSRAQVATQPSAASPAPPVTVIGREVLNPATPDQLPPAPPSGGAALPTFMVEETEPAFVPSHVLGDAEAESDYRALAALVDRRVKRQTSIAVFAILAIAGLAVLIYFGAR